MTLDDALALPGLLNAYSELLELAPPGAFVSVGLGGSPERAVITVSLLESTPAEYPSELTVDGHVLPVEVVYTPATPAAQDDASPAA